MALIRNSKQLSVGRSVLTNPDALVRFRAKLANARYKQVHIGVYGDSVVEGAYSNDAGTSDVATWRVRGWVPQLRALFADRYGDPGEGFLKAENSSLWVKGGGAAQADSSSVGAFKTHIPLDATGETVTVTTSACTDIILHAWWVQGTTGQIIYNIDAAGDTTAAASSGSDTFYAVKVTGLSSATHEVILKKPASGSAPIIGISCLNGTSSGVVVHRIPKSGAVMKDMTLQFDGNTASGNRSLDSQSKLVWTSNGAATNPIDLAVLAFTNNNITGGWSTYSLTPAQVATGWGLVLDRLIANGTDVVILLSHNRAPSDGAAPYTQAEYDAALRGLVASRKANVALIDMKRAWGSYDDANGRGWLQDTVHPKLIGHSDYAKIVFEALGGV